VRRARLRLQWGSRVLGVIGVWAIIGILAALAVAVAWIPLRRHNAPVDVALALVVVITAMGASGRRSAVACAAVAAAVGFTFFDTTPYERFTVARLADVETAVLLVVVGVVTGELAVRVARQRRTDLTRTGDLGRVRAAASRLAAGEELIVMIGSVADELTRLLDLRDCWFVADAIEPGERCVGREGNLYRAGGAGPVLRSAYRHTDQVALPVWGQGQVLGHFVLELPVDASLRQEQLLVAITLADQVGAALYAQAPPGPPIIQTPATARTTEVQPAGARLGPVLDVGEGDGGEKDDDALPPSPHLRVIRDGERPPSRRAP
jgi:hypothetical protein